MIDAGQKIKQPIAPPSATLLSDDNNTQDTSTTNDNNDGRIKQQRQPYSLLDQLHEFNRRTLLACAGSLKEYLEEIS